VTSPAISGTIDSLEEIDQLGWKKLGRWLQLPVMPVGFHEVPLGSLGVPLLVRDGPEQDMRLAQLGFRADPRVYRSAQDPHRVLPA
jgi:hypothetical protein